MAMERKENRGGIRVGDKVTWPRRKVLRGQVVTDRMCMGIVVAISGTRATVKLEGKRRKLQVPLEHLQVVLEVWDGFPYPRSRLYFEIYLVVPEIDPYDKGAKEWETRDEMARRIGRYPAWRWDAKAKVWRWFE